MPILAALYHPPGAIARHDAVAWGYAIGAARGLIGSVTMTPSLVVKNIERWSRKRKRCRAIVS